MFKINIVIPVLFFLVSCGGGGESGSVPDLAPIPIPTVSISANPVSLFVNEQVAISWSSTNSTACKASESRQGVKSTSGEEIYTITVEASHEYKIKRTLIGM